MDNLENQPAPQTDVSELRAQCASLRQLVNALLLILLVVSGTLWIFLRWQVKNVRTELESARPQATNIIAQYEKGVRPTMDEFVKRITEYSKTHPDFAPIAAKYRLNEQQQQPAKPGAAKPAPATPAPPAPAPKK